MMKRYLALTCLLFAGAVFSELPIPQTTFRKAPISKLKQIAEKGNAEAQLELALRYYAGHQVERDATQALQWMLLAAEQKHAEATYLLSRMYADGVGTTADPEKEELWFARAIAISPNDEELREKYDAYLRDEARSERVFRHCVEAGYGVAVRQAELSLVIDLYNQGRFRDALPLFVELAEAGSGESAFYAGKIFASEQSGSLADAREAFFWMEQAAEAGYGPAQAKLALMYEQGTGIPKDQDAAFSWYERAAENGIAEAQFKAAGRELARAQRYRGVAREDGASGSYKKHLNQSVFWYRAAADQGHASAQYMMGRLCASGEGVGIDYQESLRYYRAAAEQGHAEAIFYLGLMHHAGLGVQKDPAKAIEKYELAAEAGVQGALFYLANAYRFGDGVPERLSRGEGMYRDDVLKGFSRSHADADQEVSEWSIAAAREYGIICWADAERASQLVSASGWVAMAAQNGDEAAGKILSDMNKYCRRVRRDKELDPSRIVFSETHVDPAADAGRSPREFSFFPYVQRSLDDLLMQDGTRRKIISVVPGLNSARNVAGGKMDGLRIKYERPVASKAVDFSGIVLVGLEFTDRESGERYWSFAEYDDPGDLLPDPTVCDLFVSVLTGAMSDVKLSAWSVVYGHLLSDGRTVAVYDARESKVDSLPELFQRNITSHGVENMMRASVDIIRTIEGHQQSPEEESIFPF